MVSAFLCKHLHPTEVLKPRDTVGLECQDPEVRTHPPQQLNPVQLLLGKRKLFQIIQAP